MKICLDGLQDGTHRQDWSGQIEGIDLVYPEIAASVKVGAKIHRLRDVITVRGNIRARLDRPCDRCLSSASLGLEAVLHIVIRQRTVSGDPEEGDGGEVLLSVPREEQEVDLINQIRDALIVEVPMAVYCKDTCRGLCPTCGADLNEGACSCAREPDERWSTLGKILRE